MKMYNFGVFGVYEAFNLVRLEKEIMGKQEVKILMEKREEKIQKKLDDFSEVWDIVNLHSKEMFIPIPEQMKEYFDLDDTCYFVYNPRY